jgi:3',5'-cyclic AMP phosphodiesterase CpdA
MVLTRRLLLGVLVSAAALGGCGGQSAPPYGDAGAIRDALDAAGRRLSRRWSARELEELSRDGRRLLGVLSRTEREVLASCYLRFAVDVPVEVWIAAAPEPFWLVERGFRPTGYRLENDDATWTLHRRTFPAGWVNLGVNGLDWTPRGHYVVFLQSAQRGSTLTLQQVVLPPEVSPEWRLEIAGAGLSAASDVARPFRWLPGELHGAIVVQPRHDRRHSTLLATSRVWKTHVPSGPIPDQVAIAYGPDPARELVWTWRTCPEIRGTGLRIVPARFQAGVDDPGRVPEGRGLRIVAGESTPLRCPNLLNDPVVRRHRVAVRDLEPDTSYFYSVGDPGSGQWGPWRVVKTGPAPTVSDRTEILYLGDPQTGLEQWGRRLSRAFRRHPGLDFVLIAGDLVDRGNERTNWDHFFLRSAEVLDRLPTMPCAGNHEYLDVGPRLYRSLFELPRNGPPGIDPELVYHFEVGGVFVAVLDSTSAVFNPDLAVRQAAWLDNALSQSHAAWKLVMFHHPVYSAHPRRDHPTLRHFWAPVFDRHHVDLVLQGHDHAYLRTHPIRGDRVVSSTAEGTVYLVAVSGDKFAEQVPRSHVAFAQANISTYQTIEIDHRENRLTYRAWTDEGRVLDQLVIEKRRAFEIARAADRPRPRSVAPAAPSADHAPKPDPKADPISSSGRPILR